MMALPRSTGTRSMTPSNGALISCCASSAFGLFKLRLGRRQRGARLVGLELGRVAPLDQPFGRVGLGLALRDHQFGHADGGFLVFGLQPQDEVALVHMLALPDREPLDDAHDAGGEQGALFRLGLARDADRARMLDARRLEHRDGAQRQGRLFGFDLLGLGLRRGAAHGGEFAGAHPCGESDQHDEPPPAYGT